MKKVGDRISYDPTTILCRGSWGTNIFLGLFQKNDKKSEPINVAVKRLQRSNLNQKSLSDIENEFIMKVTAHPNILRYICAEMDDDFLYLATDLFAGTLQSLVEGKYDGPTVGDEKEILRQITNGLAYLHGLNIIHRDVNPKNIYISKSDDRSGLPPRMKLADFGFCTVLFTNSNQIDNDFETSSVKASQREETINSAGKIYRNPLGTEGWMAPELFHSDHYDFKVDIWALGCIFGYTLSRGKHPFGSNYIRQSVQIKNQKPMVMTLTDFKSSYAEDDLLAIFELMQSMLEVDPVCRPTVEGVLNHPSLKNLLSSEIGKSKFRHQEYEQSEIENTYETIPHATSDPNTLNMNQEKKRPKKDYSIATNATKGEAKQIIVFDEKKKLELNKMELEKILNQENVKGLPIVVLSVIGPYRTGKSFLLSWLIRYFKADVKNSEWINQYEKEEKLSQFFKWRSGSKAETQGIWAWSEVFITDVPSGEKVGVLLIDTQGLFDDQNTTKQNGNIFTLSTLISSIQIYNLRSAVQEDCLANLQLFSEFGRLALDQKSNSNTMKPFQRILFLIRDWPSPKEHSYGSKGGKDYIDNYLKYTKEEEGTELGERRRQIRQFFSNVDCYLMPKPGEKIETDESDHNSSLSDMNANFKYHLGELPAFLFPNGAVGQVKRVAGTMVLAGDLADFVEYYANLLNSDDNISPHSVSQAMTEIHNNTVARNAVKEYKTLITYSIEKELIDTFLTEFEIIVKHSSAEKKALNYFSQRKIGDDDSNSTILSRLQKDINDEYENWKSKNELVKAEIVRLNETNLKKAETTYTTSMEEWLKRAKPFANFEQMIKKHQEIRESMKNYLESRLKGPEDFVLRYMTQLKQFIENHFLKVIENERENERAENEEAQLAAAKAEVQRENLAALIHNLKKMSLEKELEKDKSKQEKIREEAERGNMDAEIFKEADKLRYERELQDAIDLLNSTNKALQYPTGIESGIESGMIEIASGERSSDIPYIFE